jgi:hypothetical protein
MLALLIAALLSPAALGLSLAVIILALAAAAFPSLGANGLVRGLFAVGLPWLIGQAALGPLGWSSVTLAALYVVSYAALLDQRFGRGDRRLWLNAAQGLGVVVLLVVGQPILAGIVVLIVLPQIALQSFLSRGEGQWYVQYAQPLVMIGMLVAAIGVIG